VIYALGLSRSTGPGGGIAGTWMRPGLSNSAHKRSGCDPADRVSRWRNGQQRADRRISIRLSSYLWCAGLAGTVSARYPPARTFTSAQLSGTPGQAPVGTSAGATARSQLEQSRSRDGLVVRAIVNRHF